MWNSLGCNGRTQHAFCPGCLMANLTNAAPGISATEMTGAHNSVPGEAIELHVGGLSKYTMEKHQSAT